MKFAASILVVLFWLTGVATAQVKSTPNKRPATNQIDKSGVRIGLWWIESPERMGEAAYTEFGHYDHGHKTGRWYKMDAAGDLISIESYKDNVLNGEARYFEKGKLACVGHYRGMNPTDPYDTIVVVDPTSGYEQIRAINAENATQRHGTWKYYDPLTGKLVREEEYQVDNLIYHKDYPTNNFDSLAYLQHVKNLPHNKHLKTRAPKDLSVLKN